MSYKKKKKTFFHCFFVLVLKRAVLSRVRRVEGFLALEKNPEKKSFSFFFIDQIVIVGHYESGTELVFLL
jgi:hypothetical protein